MIGWSKITILLYCTYFSVFRYNLKSLCIVKLGTLKNYSLYRFCIKIRYVVIGNLIFKKMKSVCIHN